MRGPFEELKTALVSSPTLTFFDASKLTILHTDAARKGGLGFALMQREEDGDHLLLCGSRVTSPTEQRYSVSELEFLAVIWAVEKCRLYLMGRPFTVITDHRALVPIINSKDLCDLNGRLLRLRERLLPYTVWAEWRAGSEHRVPDALSRAPVDQPTAEDEALQTALTDELEVRVNACSIFVGSVPYTFQDAKVREDPARDLRLQQIREATKADPTMQVLTKIIMSGFPTTKSCLSSEVLSYWNVRDQLSVLEELVLFDGDRIVIPQCMRKDVLALLHAGHQGLTKTRRLAQETVYWPGITADIKSTVEGCSACDEQRPSLPGEPLISTPVPEQPFIELHSDTFNFRGSHFLLIVDRTSCWWTIQKFKRGPDSPSTVKFFENFILEWGSPRRIRTDGGTNYTGSDFVEWCSKNYIEHCISAPYHHQSNGLAEITVRAAKRLLEATNTDDPGSFAFRKALREFRNTPMADGRPAPSVLVFGRPVNTELPRFASSATVPDKPKPKGRELPTLQRGNRIVIQDPITKTWTTRGQVRRVSGRNLELALDRGGLLWRNRRQVRTDTIANDDPDEISMEEPLPLPNRPRGRPPGSKRVRFDVPSRQSERVKSRVS